MAQVRVKKKEETRVEVEEADSFRPAKNEKPVLKAEPVEIRPRKELPSKEDVQIGETERRRVERQLKEHEDEARFQREREEMQRVHDLEEVDDDVEDEATLYEWRAVEHTHRPKTPAWFAALAVGTTIVVGIQLFMLNIFGAITIAATGAAIYYIAQKKPKVVRYRIMMDGIAINNLMYHWRDLDKFNVVYEPEEEVMTVIFMPKKLFSPHIHMEIGEANPIEIRDVLLEFLDEDQEMEEPLSDVIARRLGF
jgi:hypothetical protein